MALSLLDREETRYRAGQPAGTRRIERGHDRDRFLRHP
jgi:hypothetical protein